MRSLRTPARTLLIAIEPITPLNAFVFKAVRLRALQDAPHAFGSTYARESQFPDSEWLTRVERMNGERGAGFLAMDGETPCGIVGSFLDQNDPTRVHLVSMWTAPTHRQHGIGRLLVKEVVDWAYLRHARTLLLTVTSNNEPAIRFYERLGFTRTGRTEPYPNDPAVIEYEMSRPIP
jgi:ribosomal protein S18 acetylase RimI-like enzyme